MEKEVKPKGRALVVKSEIFRKLELIKLEYAFRNEQSTTYNDVITYLLHILDIHIKRIEEE